MKKWIGSVGVAVAFFATGCASDGDSRSTGQVIDDTAILTKAKAALVNDPVVSGMAINVDVDRGVVTLNGAVNGDTERRKAEEIARGVEGVRGVENNLVVRSKTADDTVRTEVEATGRPADRDTGVDVKVDAKVD